MEETLGQYLRRKREARLISIEEVSHATGIDIPLVAALEENYFHLIPQQELAETYLKSYAACLSLDKKDVLKRYQAECKVNQQKKYYYPRLSSFSEGYKSFKGLKKGGNFSGKRFFPVIFWTGIVVWALMVLYLYVNLLPSKTEAPENREISAPASRAPYRTAVPVEQNTGVKELNPPVQRAPQLPAKLKVVGNRDSKRYHMPGMKYYDKVRLHHRVTFNSEMEAIKAGYIKARE